MMDLTLEIGRGILAEWRLFWREVKSASVTAQCARC